MTGTMSPPVPVVEGPGPRRPLLRRAARKATRTLVVVILGVPLFALAAGAGALALLLHGDLPGTVPRPHERVVSMPTTVVDAAGQPLGTFREFELTVPTQPGDIPQVLRDAVVAAEDRQFWEHEGVDLRGLARAALENSRRRAVVQGGSTITQQLVKNRYLSTERTLDRKLDEMILAARLEQERTKEEILFEYLDTTYFGAGAYGVGAAARTYFHKSVSELTASEAALLAGLIPAPSELGPRENPFGAEARRQEVLQAMHEEGYLDDAELERALAEQLWFAGLGAPDRPATVYHPAEEPQVSPSPYFLDAVRQELVARLGEDLVFRGGLRVETTLDPGLQAAAEESVASTLEGIDPPVAMSLVAVDPATGHVRALVGGRDWSASQVNLALGGSLGMQPGSSFKPFVLAAALEAGIDPDTVYPAPASWSVPGCAGEGCTVQNYGGRSYGSMTLRSATWSSVNTVYAALIDEVGPDRVAALAARLGISTIDPETTYGVSLALGAAEVSPLDMAGAYAVLAARGRRAAPTTLARVTAPDGSVLLDHRHPAGEQVMHPAVADTVTDVLAGVVTSGTGTAAGFGRPVAGKTGTAEDYRAAWFVGYTPQLATAVWMGHADQPRPLEGIGGYATVTGGSLPAEGFASFMSRAHEGWPELEFTEPGPLPAPEGRAGVVPGPRDWPSAPPLSCGGRCDVAPSPTTVPTDPAAAADPAAVAAEAATADPAPADPASADPDLVDPDPVDPERTARQSSGD